MKEAEINSQIAVSLWGGIVVVGLAYASRVSELMLRHI
jgi:hypothetical protein